MSQAELIVELVDCDQDGEYMALTQYSTAQSTGEGDKTLLNTSKRLY